MPAPAAVQTSAPPTDTKRRIAPKVIALLEVVGLFIVGNFAAGLILERMDLKPMDFAAAKPDYLAGSVWWIQRSSVIYACLLGPAFLIGWSRRRWRPANYGVTRAGRPLSVLIGTGLLAAALVALPIKLLVVASEFADLGSRPAVWALLDKDGTFSFWVFWAVASFGFQPTLEELFYRGYCQTRLEEEFGGVGAIVIVSLFMILAHDQYHHLDILNLGIIVTGVPLIVGMGYVYWRTRSLVPAIVLHGAINVPLKGVYLFAVLAVMVLALVWFRRLWWPEVKTFGHEFALHGKGLWVWGATLFACAMNLGFEKDPKTFFVLGALCLAIALLTVIRGRGPKAVA